MCNLRKFALIGAIYELTVDFVNSKFVDVVRKNIDLIILMVMIITMGNFVAEGFENGIVEQARHDNETREAIEIRGQYGDSFGWLTSIFTASGFVLLLFAYIYQKREYKLASNELKMTRETMQRQGYQAELTERIKRHNDVIGRLNVKEKRGYRAFEQLHLELTYIHFRKHGFDDIDMATMAAAIKDKEAKSKYLLRLKDLRDKLDRKYYREIIEYLKVKGTPWTPPPSITINVGLEYGVYFKELIFEQDGYDYLSYLKSIIGVIEYICDLELPGNSDKMIAKNIRYLASQMPKYGTGIAFLLYRNF